MTVVEVEDATGGEIVGVTEAFCIYRPNGIGPLVVSRWRDLALANVCPVRRQAGTSVATDDRRNASAAVLQQRLSLKQFGFTPVQQAAHDELVAELCE